MSVCTVCRMIFVVGEYSAQGCRPYDHRPSSSANTQRTYSYILYIYTAHIASRVLQVFGFFGRISTFFKKRVDNPGGIWYHSTRSAEQIWGYSSAGRALEWHSRGQRFDPAYLHQKKETPNRVFPFFRSIYPIEPPKSRQAFHRVLPAGTLTSTEHGQNHGSDPA